jgi:hypothetical protein
MRVLGVRALAKEREKAKHRNRKRAAPVLAFWPTFQSESKTRIFLSFIEYSK